MSVRDATYREVVAMTEAQTRLVTSFLVIDVVREDGLQDGSYLATWWSTLNAVDFFMGRLRG